MDRRLDAVLTLPMSRIVAVLVAAHLLGQSPATAAVTRATYPLAPHSQCRANQTCQQLLDVWNSFAWADLVDEDFNTGSLDLAAVRWYTTENPCTGPLCNDQLNSGEGSCPVRDALNHQFCGATDELGNVLLSHAMGSNQTRYEKLHNFTELLRLPAINNLQCWMYYVNGRKTYAGPGDLCVRTDSASDASLRILGAYGIACAKQRSGLWEVGAVDYCADYEEQGAAIWEPTTSSHGEVKLLTNGQYYLANGFQNQVGAPTNYQAFRPDYYELQFLMDFAEYSGNALIMAGVLDMLEDYHVSIGTNHVHRGKTGHFNAATTSHTCDDLCTPPYLDNVDTWRAVPALSGLLNVHPEGVSPSLETAIFGFWWENYSGGHASLYGAATAKPFEIYSDASDGLVKQTDDGYKTLGMWMPLAAAYSSTYTRAAIDYLVSRFDFDNGNFYGAAYYGGYYSQFAQRAIGAATGMIDPTSWLGAGFYTLTPCRIYDSRSDAPLVSDVPRTLVVAGSCGIPESARVVSANVTALDGTGTGQVNAYAGGQSPPGTGIVYFIPAKARANNALIAVGAEDGGTITTMATIDGGGSVHLLLDVNGYFE